MDHSNINSAKQSLRFVGSLSSGTFFVYLEHDALILSNSQVKKYNSEAECSHNTSSTFPSVTKASKTMSIIAV